MNNWTCPHEPVVACHKRREVIPGMGEAGPYSICPVTQTHCYNTVQMALRTKLPDLSPPATPNGPRVHIHVDKMLEEHHRDMRAEQSQQQLGERNG